jgi:hypothetical protein
MTWSETFLAMLKHDDARLVTYVPDNVPTLLIKRWIASSLRSSQ